MKGAGASARYFGAYYARIYWGEMRTEWKIGSTIGDNASTPDSVPGSGSSMPYGLTAYELRRLLALAREHGKRFSITYTRLPPAAIHASPATWRDYLGQSVTLVEDPALGTQRCTVAGGAECAASELAFAFAPAPRFWLTRVLMQYPVPLLPESAADPGSEIHCSA
mmetsp:Transcript_99119/g.278621  ORF Transcript_99119/g.278621 Transcript_99119/m.278621 type:complete len:166 (-) Transcript_99119:52-549(-)